MKRPLSKVPEDLIYDASREHIAWQAIGIFDEQTGAWGTGTAIKSSGRSLIITAGHVLEGVKPHNLTFALRGDSALIEETPATRFRIIQKEVEAIKLPILDLLVSDGSSDLGFILLDDEKLAENNKLFFFRVPRSSG